MELNLRDYISYLREHKKPSEKTLKRYEDTLKVIGIDYIDSDKLPDLYKELLKILKNKGYAYELTYIAIMSAWLKKNGLRLTKEINYYTLQDEIKKLMGSRDAYNDEELNFLFAAVHGKGELRKAMLLMLYSGLRIGACYPIYYDKVEKVDGYDLYTYEVFSKGVKYNAIISGKVWSYIQGVRGVNQKLVVQYDSGYTTPFDKLYRDELNRCMIKFNLYRLREGKSIFHSLRKSFSQKLLASALEPTEYTYKALMGHIPHNTTATKFYITPDGRKLPLELIKRMAEAYSKTQLATMELGIAK